jgi:hypothetical protein
VPAGLLDPPDIEVEILPVAPARLDFVGEGGRSPPTDPACASTFQISSRMTARTLAVAMSLGEQFHRAGTPSVGAVDVTESVAASNGNYCSLKREGYSNRFRLQHGKGMANGRDPHASVS